MKNIFNFLKKDNIGNPPYDYYFLKNLDEKEYPKYLAKLFYMNTGEKLPLKYDFKNKLWIIDKKKCKTFNQKIQWIKLYGVTDLMRKCTDKVLVRDYVAEKIGSEYLKPVLQVIPEIPQSALKHLSPLRGKCHGVTKGGSLVPEGVEDNGVSKSSSSVTKVDIKEVVYDNEENIYHSIQHTLSVANEPPYPAKAVLSPQGGQMSVDSCRDVTTYFDKIDWENLPNSFVIKCNHGCKWQFIIKDKEAFLQNKRLFDIVKRNMTGWLEQDYSFWNGFEMQYKNIQPKSLIEKLMKENRLIEVYCFNGIPKFFADIHLNKEVKICTYNEDYIPSDLVLKPEDKVLMKEITPDENIKQSIDLCKKISKDFKFVRVDWMLYEDRLYFEELTFTPYSGYSRFTKKWNLKIGNLINI